VPTYALFGGLLSLYMTYVRKQRWKRYNAVHTQYEEKFRAGKLTPENAQEIFQLTFFYDMPTLTALASAYALIKAYDI
ncbi:hypothetical protein FISHEDRAFT_10948, partial [Fistulina hepatica ATCC 64428]